MSKLLRAGQRVFRSCGVAVAAAMLAAGCGGSLPSKAPARVAGPGAAPVESASQLAARARAELGPLPAAPELPPALVALGRRLFFETRVSADEHVGCVTCHQPALWGTDGLPLSRGVFGRQNPRNAPTVLNAAYQFAEHWRADRKSVEDQAEKALLGHASFGVESNELVVQRLGALPEYAVLFEQAFPGDAAPISVAHWGSAIGAYERTLLTPAPIDAFMAGDTAALSSEAQAGLRTFLDVGCAECHDGPLVGGDGLRRFGEVAPYAEFTHSSPIDLGRYDVTHQESDRFVFKVPSLRNVQKTAPYFHDGSVSELPQAVRIMARTQLGKALSEPQVAEVVAFLATLTGPVPAAFAPPE